ncbi:EF-hand calcium-binding domain-containing protein 1 [Scaptodrosophila lebanonensis]|uniref:EF-hand calcium-binding domain-containing protein 1 n=1 Tax=Drosophila lebanonensis TaxID=7225 RepID=A0A6J2T2D6_DROLE|nr:EF-hand calcium-binding domain-containing protein 1 [Scaptodrosophila lebanonensis]
MKLDSTLNDREDMRFKTLFHRQIVEIARHMPFSETEVSSILMVYYKFAKGHGKPGRNISLEQFINMIGFFQQYYDFDQANRIATVAANGGKAMTAMDFVNFMYIITTDDLEAKIDFAYKVYDKADKGINRFVVTSAVTKFFTVGDDDELNELRKDMADFLILKFDLDRDGVITFDEYKTVVMRNPALLEFLGPIFPSTGTRQLIAYCTAITSLIPELRAQV